MSISWNVVSNSSNGSSAANIVFPDGTIFDVTSEHPNYSAIVGILVTLNGDYDVDEAMENIERLVNVATTISQRLTSLSERVTTDGSDIYFDGDAVDSSVGKYLLKALRRDGITSVSADSNDTEDDFSEMSNVSWRGIVAFMEKLYQNPSKESIEHLYSFIRMYDLTIRENGDFIAFKGLRTDFTSVHNGPGIINGVKFDNAHLDNSPGNVVEIARSYVNTSREHGCSTGLHCGTLSFARGFAGRGKLVSVAVNPRDVVSVPEDHAFQKVRVSRYEVLSETPNDFTDEDRDFFWGDEDSEFDDDYEECSYCYNEIDPDDESFTTEWDETICETCDEELNEESDFDEFDHEETDNENYELSDEDKELNNYYSHSESTSSDFEVKDTVYEDDQPEFSNCSNCGKEIYVSDDAQGNQICKDCQLDEKESNDANNNNPGVSFL